MTRTRGIAILAVALAALAAGRAIAQPASAQSAPLVGATIYSDTGERLGTIARIIVGADGRITQAVIATEVWAESGPRLVAVPYGQLRFETRPGMVDVTAGFGVTASAAPGVTGPFGTAHLASTDAATATQPEGGPLGTEIVLPGATIASLNSMPPAR